MENLTERQIEMVAKWCEWREDKSCLGNGYHYLPKDCGIPVLGYFETVTRTNLDRVNYRITSDGEKAIKAKLVQLELQHAMGWDWHDYCYGIDKDEVTYTGQHPNEATALVQAVCQMLEAQKRCT